MLYVIMTLVAALGIYGFSFIIEWILVKRIMDNGAHGLIVSLCASFLVSFVPLLLSSDAESSFILVMILGFLIALAISYPSYRRRKQKEDGMAEGSD